MGHEYGLPMYLWNFRGTLRQNKELFGNLRVGVGSGQDVLEKAAITFNKNALTVFIHFRFRLGQTFLKL